MLQKHYVVKIIEADDNICLVTALAIEHERSLEAAHGAKKMKNKFRRYKPNPPLQNVLSTKKLQETN